MSLDPEPLLHLSQELVTGLPDAVDLSNINGTPYGSTVVIYFLYDTMQVLSTATQLFWCRSTRVPGSTGDDNHTGQLEHGNAVYETNLAN